MATTQQRVPVFIDVSDDRLSWKGGLNTRSSRILSPEGTQYALRRDQLTMCENLDRNESGQLVGRYGTEKIHQAKIVPPLGDSVIRSQYEYRKLNRETYLLATAGNGVYSYDFVAQEYVLRGTVPAPNENIIWVTFMDLAFGISEGNPLFSFDGFAVTPIVQYTNPGGTAMCVYRGRLFIAYGMTIFYCALNAPLDWTTANNAGAIPALSPNGTVVTGFQPFWSQLIIHTDEDTARLVGTSPVAGTADFFRYEQVNTRYGHGARQAGVVAAKNDEFFMSKRAVHKLSTVQATPELGDVVEDAESFYIEPTWNALDEANMPNRFAVDVTTKGFIIFGVGEHSIWNQVAYVADYNHLDEMGHVTWGKYFPFPFASGIETRRAFRKRTVLLGGQDGFVYKMSDVATDNGNPIFCRAQFISDMKNPGWEKTFRYLIPLIEPPDALQGAGKLLGSTWVMGVDPLGDASSFVVRASWETNGARSILQQAVGLGIAGAFKKLGVDWVLGSDALGGVSIIKPRVSIPGHGRDVEITLEYTGSRRIKIHGLFLYGSLRRLIL